MDFKRITIPYAGREKYPSNGTGASIRTMITNMFGGGAGSAAGGDASGQGGSDNRGGLANASFCFLSKTSGVYSAVELVSGVTDTIFVMGYKDNSQAQTFIGDMSSSSQTQNYGITGLPESGMSVVVEDNGTTGTTIKLTFSGASVPDSGTLAIPVAINLSDNSIDPYHEVWYQNSNKCNLMELRFSWTVNRASTTSYVLDLSNQTAQVNCDSAGTLYPNSIATLGCSATTYYNGAVATGITYSVNVNSAFAAIGINSAVTNNVLVLTFNSGGTNQFYWNPNYPSLPIDIVASKDGHPIATKTMTISRNYPGEGGTPAHTWYIVTDYDVVRYDPNTTAFTPNHVVGTVMLQVGDQEPVFDPNPTIYMWYNDIESGATHRFGQITGNTYDGLTSITFALKNSDGDYYEIEEVPVISQGKDGENGEPGTPGTPGTPGASGESAWYLTLSNDNASINCDSDGDILPEAIRPTCEAKLYHGRTRITNVDYNVDYGGATGVDTGYTNGILTLIFNDGDDNPPFDFDDTSVQITISASTESTLRDVKVMTISKSYPGENGEPGVSYWLQPSHGEIIFDPNTNTPDPSSITCTAYKQVGDDGVVPATNVSIWYCWQPNGGTFGPETKYTGSIRIYASDCEDYRRLRFVLHYGSESGGTVLDIEDVDILKDGVSGETITGRPGPAIRGPYDYAEHSASTRCWCAGESGGSCSDCDKWIDVVLCGNTYYYCNTTYNGTLASHFPGYWTSGASFDFIAANLLLANNAKIKFITNNALYLMDGTDITGGAMGGSGLNFWAGGDPSAVSSLDRLPFRVYNDGTIYAQKGIFAGYVQFPYVKVSQLTHSGRNYQADGRAYIIAPTTGTEVQEGYEKVLILPAATADLNGFTYEILVEPGNLTAVGPYTDSLKLVAKTGSGSATGDTLYCYAFTTPTYSEQFMLDGGQYRITCLPDNSDDYRWVITNVTGGIWVDHNGWHYMSTVLGSSTEKRGMINEIRTYTGNRPGNSNNVMYVKK